MPKFKTPQSVWDSFRYKVMVLVVDARDLRGFGKKGTCNPRVSLKYGSVQHKTPTVKQNRSPIWNDTVLFLSEPTETLLFEVRNEHNKGIGKPNFMGIASIKNVLGLPMNIVHDLSLTLLPRENKPTDQVSGVLNVRILVSTAQETRPRGPGFYRFLYDSCYSQIHTGDLILYGGYGVQAAATQLHTNSPYSSIGLVLELANLWTQRIELYVLELTRNIDHMIDAFSESSETVGVNLFRLFERIHQFHGGNIWWSRLATPNLLDESSKSALVDWIWDRQITNNYNLSTDENMYATEPVLVFLREVLGSRVKTDVLELYSADFLFACLKETNLRPHLTKRWPSAANLVTPLALSELDCYEPPVLIREALARPTQAPEPISAAALRGLSGDSGSLSLSTSSSSTSPAGSPNPNTSSAVVVASASPASSEALSSSSEEDYDDDDDVEPAYDDGAEYYQAQGVQARPRGARGRRGAPTSNSDPMARRAPQASTRTAGAGQQMARPGEPRLRSQTSMPGGSVAAARLAQPAGATAVPRRLNAREPNRAMSVDLTRRPNQVPTRMSRDLESLQHRLGSSGGPGPRTRPAQGDARPAPGAQGRPKVAQAAAPGSARQPRMEAALPSQQAPRARGARPPRGAAPSGRPATRKIASQGELRPQHSQAAPPQRGGKVAAQARPQYAAPTGGGRGRRPVQVQQQQQQQQQPPQQQYYEQQYYEEGEYYDDEEYDGHATYYDEQYQEGAYYDEGEELYYEDEEAAANEASFEDEAGDEAFEDEGEVELEAHDDDAAGAEHHQHEEDEEVDDDGY